MIINIRMKIMQLSIIIPTYNSEKYIRQTLNSLITGTEYASNVEILVFDDGSIDRTLEIVNEYAQKDDRLRVFKVSHMGPANIKNYALDKASGRYVAFLDSDDIVVEGYIKKILNLIVQENPDLIIFKYDEFFESLDDRRHKSIGGYTIDTMGTMIWNKVYSSEILQKTRFPENTIYEDVLFSAEALIKSEKILNLNEVLYFYRQRSNSITTATNTSLETHLDILTDINFFFKKVEQKEIAINKAQRKQLSITINNLILDHSKKIIKSSFSYTEKKIIIKKLIYGSKDVLLS
ncbi:glycosyltransferase family 2 protein [Pediococcus stilesii]|uniref:Glycosyltransferase family 2 protein n=2 Tax=Pediococcus stilesii TaxID=331679 RepID=A0A5R9BQE1_9LACO|nr:glycosyltransferase family 2 protein [Pediococcus stilesii]